MSGWKRGKQSVFVVALAAIFVLPFFYVPSVSFVQAALSAAQAGDYFQNLQKQIDALRSKIAQKEETFKELEEEAKNLNNQIKGAQKKETTLKNQIDQFNQRIGKLALDIRITEIKVTQHILEIEELALEIKRSEEVIQRNKKNLVEIVRAVHWYDQANLLELLLQANKFSDFLNQAEYVQRVQHETQRRLEEIKLTKFKLGEEKSEVEVKKLELEGFNQELAGQKFAVENQKNDKEYLLKVTRNQERTYQTLLTETQKKREAVQKEIYELEDKLKFTIDPNSIPAPRSGILFWPNEGILTQGYGMTAYAKTGVYGGGPHNGIDIAAGFGKPIRAAKEGKVVGVKDAPYAYGRWIAIEHDNGLTTLYGHLSSQIVSEGQGVKRGQIIGYEGSTGLSTGSHLHFTVYATNTFQIAPSKIAGLLPVGGSINPLDYL